jgi:DNA repair protein RadC
MKKSPFQKISEKLESLSKLEFIPEIGIIYKHSKNRQKYLAPDFDVKDLLRPFFDKNTIDLQEEFVVAFLDIHGKPIGVKRMFIGNQTMTPADHTLVFQMAILFAAHSIVLAHNHPGDVIYPSDSDIDLFLGFQVKGHILGIEVDDMVIFGKNGSLSLTELGYLRGDADSTDF